MEQKQIIDMAENKKSFKQIFKTNWEYVVMCLPIVIKTIIFSVLPLLWLLMAFQDYNGNKGIFGSEWVWFANFEYFVVSDNIWRVIGNTLGLNVMFIVIGTPITIIMALFMYEMKNRFLTKLFQTIYFFPYLISWVVVQYSTDAILNDNGLINSFLISVGATPIKFFAEESAKIWPIVLLFCNFWKGTGYSLIMYYAALGSLDTEQLEAAELDGANRAQKMWHISLPHLRKIIAILLIMSMGGVFRSDFGLFWFIPKNDTDKTLLSTTEVLDTYIYQLSINDHNVSAGTAIGLVQSIVGTITLLITNFVVKKIDKESAYI